ncbi:hypothetical protein ACFU5N_18530 [Streptomyces albidoflavus]
MDLPALLASASLLVPEEDATENDLTVRDVWDLLAGDDWETALNLLEELAADPGPLPAKFWGRLGEAAEQYGLERSAVWCHWRSAELRNGMVRASLTLRPAGETRRTTPVPGAGVLRPLWDIGGRSPTGERAVSIAALWVEALPHLEPGGTATVRLLPLTPAHWAHLRPGTRITMYEDSTPAGTAVVLEVRLPAQRRLGDDPLGNEPSTKGCR